MPDIPGFIGNDNTLSYSTDDGATWTPCANVTDIDIGEAKTTKVPFKLLANSNYTKHYKPGLKDPPEIKVAVNFVPAETATIYGMWKDRTVCLWRVEGPDEDEKIYQFQGPGFISAHKLHKAPDDDGQAGEFTIAATDEWDITPAVEPETEP